MNNSEFTVLHHQNTFQNIHDITNQFFQKVQKYQGYKISRQLQNNSIQDSFLIHSQQIGQQLRLLQIKVSKLKEILKKSNLFNRQDELINELSNFINQNINNCQDSLQQYQKDVQTNNLLLYKSIYDILQGRIIEISTNFKKQLQLRTEDLKRFENKKQIIYNQKNISHSNNINNNNSNGVKKSINNQQMNGEIQQNECQIKKRQKIDYTRRNIFLENNNSNQDEINIEINENDNQQSVLIERRDQKRRNQSMKHVEGLLTEIGGIFQKLGSIVQYHDVMIDRIDRNTDDTLFNVQKGKENLTKTYNQVSSNRTLIIKVLLILFFFAFLYITFLL